MADMGTNDEWGPLEGMAYLEEQWDGENSMKDAVSVEVDITMLMGQADNDKIVSAVKIFTSMGWKVKNVPDLEEPD